MGFEYDHLDEDDVRDHMVDGWSREWHELHASGHPRDCYGKQLTEPGWGDFAEAMPEALAEHDDDWLRARMSNAALWQPFLMRNNPKSGMTRVNYNQGDALKKLCYGEFNIAYIRGLATALLERGETECEIYRADSAYVPRGECSGWEGTTVPLQQVIDGHRARYWPPPGDRQAWSLPTGPNCHHSIRAAPAAE